MTDDPSLSLEIIEKSLRRLGRNHLLDRLQEGIPASVVQCLLADVGLTTTAELRALYSWKNGTSTVGVATVDDIQLFPGFYLLSVEDAVAHYRAFASDDRWAEGWLPLFANGGGDFYVLDLNQPSENSVVRHFRIDESEQPIEFESLSGLLVALAGAFDQGIFFVDPDGYLEMDDLAFAALAAALNPDIDWWRA